MNYLTEKKLALSGGGWWVHSSCLAAYAFAGASDADEALKDLSGNHYNLTAYGSPSWSKTSGYRLNNTSRYLNNSTLNGKSIKTIIIRYSGLPSDNGNTWTLSRPNTSSGLLARTHLWVFYNGQTIYYGSAHGSFLSSSNGSSPLTYRESNSDSPASGVLGGDSSHLYLNGSSWGSSGKSRTHDGLDNCEGGYAKIATLGGREEYDGVYMQAAAFYSEVLPATVHKLIADNMLKF